MTGDDVELTLDHEVEIRGLRAALGDQQSAVCKMQRLAELGDVAKRLSIEPTEQLGGL